MGNKNSGKKIYQVNESFFSVWTSQMAYILGFSCADGNVYGKNLSWELSNKFESNLTLLKDFNFAMGSNYPIERRKESYRLRISNSFLLESINNLGIVPNKSKILFYPPVPEKFLPHFLRGFLDGDGWIVTRARKNGGKEICVGFCNGSSRFMNGLVNSLGSALKLKKFNLRERKKITKKGEISLWYQLEFYSESANKILTFLYGSLKKNDLFLKRKHVKFLEANDFFKEEEVSKLLGRKAFKLKNNFKKDPKEIIISFLSTANLIPREIALKLGISLSTLYRWMDKYGIQSFASRGSKQWSQKIIQSKQVAKNE